jgi:F-type H+-transporting ATPase subunit delta
VISSTLGRRYSKALLSLTLEKSASLEEIYEELELFRAALTGDPRILQAISNPNVLLAERQKLLNKMLEKSEVRPLVRNFIQLLLRRGRIDFFSDIVREFRKKADQHAGVVRASVTAAGKLTPEDSRSIAAILEKRFSKKVVLYEKTSPDLIGGLIIKSGSLSFDGSIRSQLKDIQNQLLEEVSSS